MISTKIFVRAGRLSSNAAVLNRRYVSIRDLVLGADAHSDEVLKEFATQYPQCRYVKGRYLSPWSKQTEKSFASALYWLATRKQNKINFGKWDTTRDILKLLEPRESLNKTKIKDSTRPHITYIGHATVYMQIGGLYFITDPMFSDRASPTQMFGPERYVKPPAEIEDLQIDVVLLSHTHYDHLDYNSAMRIAKKSKSALWLVPLGVKEILASWNITNVIELNWWDSHSIPSRNGDEITINFLPAKHWTSRSLFDRNTCLWGGFAVLSKECRFYFSGDTAYDGTIFKQIGERYGPFDITAIPIGAYKPRYFMKDHHCDPEEALEIHRDVRAKQSVAIHWGTFPLADEDFAEPALELARAREAKSLDPSYNSQFFTMRHGDTHVVGEKPEPEFSEVQQDLYQYYKKEMNRIQAKSL